jgi:hypothetical protein
MQQLNCGVEGKEPTVRYDGQYVDGKKHGIGVTIDCVHFKFWTV